MDTPRRGLIRSTERAIEEYIKVGCEENLPMIRQLENVVYQFWVESNTSFMNEGLVSVEEDEDGWIWDNDCFYESFQDYVKDCFEDDKCLTGSLQEEADDNSSICSSIKLCDETDCSLGYLASCEESDTDVFVHSCKNRDFVGSSGEKHASTVEHMTNNDLCASDLDYLNLQINTGHEKNMLRGCERIHNFSNSLKKSGNTRSVCDNEDINRTEINECDSDEWVWVDKDCIEMIDYNEWFIVSTPEPGMRVEDPENCNKSGNIDLSDWAVLSMRLTERTCKDESKNLRVNQTERGKCPALHDDVNELDCINPKRKIYGIPSLGGCPLCQSETDNYKCAIVCVLMQR